MFTGKNGYNLSYTDVCPLCEKLVFMFHARAAPVKNWKIFQLEFADVLRTRPPDLAAICLQSNSQHVGVFTARLSWTRLTHVSLERFQLFTLPTGGGMNWFKRCPGPQKVNCPTVPTAQVLQSERGNAGFSSSSSYNSVIMAEYLRVHFCLPGGNQSRPDITILCVSFCCFQSQ